MLTGLHWSELLQSPRGVGRKATPVRVVWSVPEPAESGALQPASWVGLSDGRVACVGRDGVILGVWACALAASSPPKNDASSSGASAGRSRVFVEAPVGGAARVAGRANELMFFHAQSRKLLFAQFPELALDLQPAHVFCVYECEEVVTSVFASLEGDVVVVGDVSGSLHCIEVESGALMAIAEGAHAGSINAIHGRAGSPPVVASCCAADGSVAVWRVALNEFQCLFRTQSSLPLSVCAIALDVVVGGQGKGTVSFNTEATKGSILSIATPSGSVLLWSSGPANDWTKLPPIDTRAPFIGGGSPGRTEDAISSLAIDYESAILAVGCKSGRMKVFDVLTASLLTTINPQPHAPSVTGSVVACDVIRDAMHGCFIAHCSQQGPPRFESMDRLRKLKDEKLKTTAHPIVPRDPFPELPSLVRLRNINMRSLPSAGAARARGDDRGADTGATSAGLSRVDRVDVNTTSNTGSREEDGEPARRGFVDDADMGEEGGGAPADVSDERVSGAGFASDGDQHHFKAAPTDDADAESIETMLEREFEALSEDLKKLQDTKEKMRDLQRLATLQQTRADDDGAADSRLGGAESTSERECVAIPHLGSSALGAPALNSTARAIGKANELTREYLAGSTKHKRQLEELIGLERDFQDACLVAKSVDVPLTKIDDSVREYVPKKVGKQLDPRWVAAHSDRPVMGDFWTTEMHEPQVHRIEPVPYRPPSSFYELTGGLNPSYAV